MGKCKVLEQAESSRASVYLGIKRMKKKESHHED